MIVENIVDNLTLPGEDSNVGNFVTEFDAMFELGSVARGLGILKVYKRTIDDEDFWITDYADENLEAIKCFLLR